MQDRVTICNDAGGEKYTRLALFFISIPTNVIFALFIENNVYIFLAIQKHI